jgi:hypothetical protein
MIKSTINYKKMNREKRYVADEIGRASGRERVFWTV